MRKKQKQKNKILRRMLRFEIKQTNTLTGLFERNKDDDSLRLQRFLMNDERLILAMAQTICEEQQTIVYDLPKAFGQYRHWDDA